MHYITKLLYSLQHSGVKLVILLSGFFLPLAPLVTVTTLVALFDWMVKLYCVYTMKGKKGLVSGKMQDTFYKIILYAVFLVVLFVVDNLFIKGAFYPIFDIVLKGIFEDGFADSCAKWITSIQLASVGTLMILFRESKSVDENWEEAFGYSPLEEVYKVIKPLIKWKK